MFAAPVRKSRVTAFAKTKPGPPVTPRAATADLHLRVRRPVAARAQVPLDRVARMSRSTGAKYQAPSTGTPFDRHGRRAAEVGRPSVKRVENSACTGMPTPTVAPGRFSSLMRTGRPEPGRGASALLADGEVVGRAAEEVAPRDRCRPAATRRHEHRRDDTDDRGRGEQGRARPARAVRRRVDEGERADSACAVGEARRRHGGRVGDGGAGLRVEGVAEQPPELVVVHGSPPSVRCRLAMPRLAADFTDPGEMPSASAISRSDSPDQ